MNFIKKTNEMFDKFWKKHEKETLDVVKLIRDEVDPVKFSRETSRDKIKAFYSARFKELGEREMEFLERIKLELDVNICSCGEEWKETDLADLVNDRIEKLKELLGG